MSDAFLTGLTALVNTGSKSSRVLLCVGGLVIRGTLISLNSYRDALSVAGGAAITARVDEVAAAYQAARVDAPRYPEREIINAQPTAIHLRDVTIAGHPDLIPLWRGMIESVDGWSLLDAGGK